MLHVFKPSISIRPFPVNAVIDDMEDLDVVPLYHVVVSQANLKMLFLVEKSNPVDNKQFEYNTIRCEYICLNGISKRDEYLGAVDDVSISADPSIVNEVFKSILVPYGLKLLKIRFHDFSFFETESEGKGFLFTDQEIYNKLKILINKRCIKMMEDPIIGQI